MYFETFPFIQYDSLGDGNPKEVKNLLRRVKVRSDIRSNSSLFDTYYVREGETPEMIADRLYDNVNLHWVVLLFNDITDRYHQWPMTTGAFNKYVADKYTNINAVHHYEITESSGDRELKIDVGITNDDYPSATPITNYEYEVARQNELRNIKLLDPRYVSDFVDEFKDLVQESVF
tara:strand:- start:13143 stop:13670 length:528 start_codon:yes stop_codon:yes gene_type:complete